MYPQTKDPISNLGVSLLERETRGSSGLPEPQDKPTNRSRKKTKKMEEKQERVLLVGERCLVLLNPTHSSSSSSSPSGRSGVQLLGLQDVVSMDSCLLPHQKLFSRLFRAVLNHQLSQPLFNRVRVEKER